MIELRVAADGVIFIDGQPLPKSELAARLEAIAARYPQPTVTFAADLGANIKDSAEVLAAIHRAGIKRSGVVGGT